MSALINQQWKCQLNGNADAIIYMTADKKIPINQVANVYNYKLFCKYLTKSVLSISIFQIFL